MGSRNRSRNRRRKEARVGKTPRVPQKKRQRMFLDEFFAANRAMREFIEVLRVNQEFVNELLGISGHSCPRLKPLLQVPVNWRREGF